MHRRIKLVAYTYFHGRSDEMYFIFLFFILVYRECVPPPTNRIPIYLLYSQKCKGHESFRIPILHSLRHSTQKCIHENSFIPRKQNNNKRLCLFPLPSETIRIRRKKNIKRKHCHICSLLRAFDGWAKPNMLLTIKSISQP